MTDYFLDDASNGTNDGLGWSTCYNTWAQVNAAGILTATNRLFVGADANITNPGAALTITGPTSSRPAVIISSTVGSGTTVSYSQGTGTQVNTTGGAFDITLDGSFALYGLRFTPGQTVVFGADSDEITFAQSCIFAPGAGNNAAISTGGNQSRARLVGCVIDFTADSTTSRSANVISGASPGLLEINGMTFTNAGYRTGAVIAATGLGSCAKVSGMDISGFPSTCEIHDLSFTFGSHEISNVLTAATWTVFGTGTPRSGGRLVVTNTGPEDAPTYLALGTYYGNVLSSAAIYRTGGATVEGIACSWLITTTANCSEGSPLYTPWIYGTTTNGTKTFTVYATCNNSSPTTATLQDDEIWLEVEYLGTADEAQWTLVTDQRATIVTAAADQTAETASTWVGLNDAGQGFADFRFKLECAAVVVGETGQYRARVAVGMASITSASYLYVDPLVTVT